MGPPTDAAKRARRNGSLATIASIRASTSRDSAMTSYVLHTVSHILSQAGGDPPGGVRVELKRTMHSRTPCCLTGGSATGLSATDAWKAVVGDGTDIGVDRKIRPPWFSKPANGLGSRPSPT